MPNTDDIVYDIPFPYEQFTDTKFIISETHQGSSLFIPDDCYTRINERQIRFDRDNKVGINEESEVRFTFIHAKNKKWIGKVEYHLKVEEVGQTEFFLPISPYNQLVNIKKRMYVFYNRARQTRGLHYKVDEYTGKIRFINKRFKALKGDRIDIVMIYGEGNNNGAIQELPQSGFISLSKYEIDRNYNPNLMAIFVDGKLVDKEDIIQMSNTLYKVNKDIRSRYNVEVRNLSPRIKSMVPYYKQHYIKQEEPIETISKNIFCRIEIKEYPKGRKSFKPQFNPVYFFSDLIDSPDLYINLILRKSSVNYDLKMYGDDFVDDPTDLNVIMQLRLKTEREYTITSKTASIVGEVKGHIESNKEDKILVSIPVRTVLEMDTSREYDAVDGIIGRLQGDITMFDSKNPIYYTFTADEFDVFTEVFLFRWTVSTEKDSQGHILWEQDINMEPENKWEILEEGG